MLTDFNLIETYEVSFRQNFNLPALTDYDTSTPTLTYGMMAERIARLHYLFGKLGIKDGDRIALAGKNSSEWATVFFATLTYGAIIVPILHEFSADDMTAILNHSGAICFFVNDSIFKNLDMSKTADLKTVFSLDSHLEVLYAEPSEETVKEYVVGSKNGLQSDIDGRKFNPQDISYQRYASDKTAVINYTSGTSGFSKGVVLSHGNLGGNLSFGLDSKLHYQGSRCLSFLPLAHAYGCAFDLLVPLAAGTHVTFLGRTPSPRTLIKAFAQVRPSLVLCVPLILEKIYKNLIIPAMNKLSIRAALKIPGVDRLIYRQIRQKLTKAFGGEFEQVIVGGAPMNSEVERFLQRIGFRFTVGYGMTECAPLISYTPWREYQLYSAGRILPGIMEVKILQDERRAESGHVTGEIVVRGVNVMKGYYKRPDLTELAMTEDGWLHTGDMGYLGDDGKTIFIRGRYKTMILGPSGQNIYPETIEDRLNAHPYILESVVVERGGRLVGLVYPDADAMQSDGIVAEDQENALGETLRLINRTLAPFERLDRLETVKEPFEKTPKKSIKRFLYS